MPTQRLLLSRPLRAVAVSFAVTASLFAACVPFIAEVNFNLATFFAGLAYCLFLSLFSVGLALAFPGRLLHWWLLSSAVPCLGMIGFWFLLRFDPETVVRAFPGATHGLLALCLAYLAVGSVVSGSGWMRYIRWHRPARSAE